MDEFEKSVAVLDRKIEHKSPTVIDLERVVVLKKLETSNSEKRDLMEELKNKDNQLIELRNQNQKLLETLRGKQAEFNKITSPECLDKAVWCCNLQVHRNEGVLDSKYATIRDRKENPKNKVKIKDEVLYDLGIELHQNEASSDDANISQNTTFHHLESELRRRDIMLRKKDEQLSDQTEQMEQHMNTLHKTKVELSGPITLLKSKNRLLEADADQYILHIKHIEKLLQCKKTEIKDIDELLAEARMKGDEQRCQLQQILKEDADKELELNRIISSLQMEIQELENESIQTKEKNLFLAMTVNVRDDQLRQKKDRLNDTLDKLHQKEIEFGGVLNSLQRKHQREIEDREMHIRNLKEELDSIKSATNERHGRLIKNLQKEEKQLSELRYHQQQEFNQLHGKEGQLKRTIIALNSTVQQVQKEKGHGLKVTHLQEIPDNVNTKIRSTIEQPVPNVFKEQDGHSSNLTDQLQITLKQQVLEAEIEQRDLKVKDMVEKLSSMRKEMFDGNELHVKQLEDKEKLLLKQKDQLQQVLTLSHEKETKLRESISSLKNQNRSLEEKTERCDSEVKRLKKVLDIKCTEILDSNKSAKEKDNQMSELKEQLQQTLKMLQCKETETQESDKSLTKKLKYLESEVERHRRNKTRLDDMLKRTELEMNQLRDRNELKENNMKEKEDVLREQCDQLNRRLKTLQEKTIGLDGTTAILKKRNKDLEADIESRSTNVKELEEQLDSLNTEQMEGIEILAREVDDKDKLQQKLNRVCKNEAESKDIITSLKKQNQTKDNQISELKVQLKRALNKMDDKEAETEELDISRKKKIKYLEIELERRERNVKNEDGMLNKIEHLENKLKEKDDQIYQLNYKLKELQEMKTSLLSTLTSIETKNKNLETDVERRDQKLKDLAEMKAETNAGYERLANKLNEKDKQLSEQRNQLQKVQEKETELNEIIVSFKMQCNEKEDQILDLREKLQQTSKMLDNKENYLKEIDTSQTTKQRHLESEIEHREQNIRHLNEMLNSKTIEMRQMIEKNTLLESMVKGKDNQLHEQRDQLNRASEALQGSEAELGGIIKTLKKKCHDLEKDIKHRDKQLRDLENKVDTLKSDKSSTKELYEKEVSQISEKSNQLQQAVKQLQETEATLKEDIAELKKQNQEKDNQIFEQGDQLKKAFDQLGAKKTENEENDMLLKKKIKYLEAELERREQNLKILENILNRNKLQENKLKEKDAQNYQLKRTLKELQETESRLVATITAIETEKEVLKKDVDRRDLKIKDLEEMLERTKKEINGEYERLEKNVHEKDKQLSDNRNQLQQVQEKVSKMNEFIILLKTQNEEKDNEISDARDQLQHASKRLDNREAELKEIDDLQKNVRYLESELDQREQNVRHLKEMLNSKTVEMEQIIEKNILLESMLKGKDNQLHEQSDQLNHASEALQEKETNLGGIINTLKKKCQCYETGIEHRDQQLHDLKKNFDKLKTDQNGRTEHHVKEVSQLSEKNNQLQQAVKQLQETEATLNEDIAALKKHNQEKDNWIFEQEVQLRKALDQLGDKKAETEENEMLLKKKIKYLEVELERREQNCKQHDELLNSNNTKMTELRYRYGRLEKMMKEKEDALRVQTNQWRQEIQNLEREVEIRDRKLNNMKETLESKKHDIREKEQNIYKDVREKNQKIVELKDQLKSTLAKLRDTETELKETKTR